MWRVFLLLVVVPLNLDAGIIGIWSNIPQEELEIDRLSDWDSDTYRTFIHFSENGGFVCCKMSVAVNIFEEDSVSMPNMYPYHYIDTFYIAVGTWRIDDSDEIRIELSNGYIECEADQAAANEYVSLRVGVNKEKVYKTIQVDGNYVKEFYADFVNRVEYNPESRTISIGEDQYSELGQILSPGGEFYIKGMLKLPDIAR